MGFDWRRFETELVSAVVERVRTARAESPDERLYGVALWFIYRELNGMIGLPLLAMNSDEALHALPPDERDELRWWPADWSRSDVDLFEADRADHWQTALTAEACRSTERHWERTLTRYFTVLVRVCEKARKELRDGGLIDSDCLVLVHDHDELYEDLLRRCLTSSELARHFPEVDTDAAERARVAALPEAEHAAYDV